MKNKPKIKINLSSATDVVGVHDNNYCYNPTNANVYLITTRAHNIESSGTLRNKVDQVVSFNSLGYFNDGNEVNINIKTSFMNKYIVIKRKNNSLIITVSGSTTAESIPLYPKLFKNNAFGAQADLHRVFLILCVYFVGLSFICEIRNEEKGFKKLIKNLWKT